MRPGPKAWTTNPETGKRELTQEYKDAERRWREGQMFPGRSEVVTRPTRDLNDSRREIARPYRPNDSRESDILRDKWRLKKERDNYDGPNPWGPGEKPIDWDRPNPIDVRPRPDRPIETIVIDDSGMGRGGRRGGKRGGRRGGRRFLWDFPRPEPRRDYPREFSNRLPSDAERMRLLTGEADPIKSPDSSRLLREDYDPVDRDFNRQFDESPRGRQPWDSDPRSNPLERDPLEGYDYKGGRDISSPVDRRTNWWNEPPKKHIETKGMGSLGNVPPRVDSRPPRNEGKGIASLIGSFITSLGNDPSRNESRTYDDTDLKKRIASLEERGSIVTQPTQDLSKITGRLSELEGRQPSWQEDRIKALEERKSDTSWKDPLSTLQTGQQQAQQSRAALDTRLAALENYYKNDPPPKQSLGSRYEDKAAEYARQWEVTPYNPESPRWEGSPQKWGEYGKEAWESELPTVYKRNMRALNREYNKPTYEATIKGRDYKAYGYGDKDRLKMLDQQNIHEDEYLGSGTWTNQWGEKITGRGRGEQDRYFTSHSGLDPQSQEYKDRFRKDQFWTYAKPGGDYSWRGDDKGYQYRSHKNYQGHQDSPFENEFLDPSGRMVKTKGGQDYLWPDAKYS